MKKTAARKVAELALLGVAAGIAALVLLIGAGMVVERLEPWAREGRRGMWLPAETGPHAEGVPFLQGGTDYGGGEAYAVMAGAGVCYLALASWLLALWMALDRKKSPDGAGWGKRTLRALWFFMPYFLVWAVMGFWPEGERWCSCEDDADVLRATVALLGVLTAAWTAWLDGRRWRFPWKLLAAPAMVALWVFMAWDGQTPRAGQRLWSGQEPLPAVRSWRHAAMLAWYDLWVERPETGGEDAWFWFWTDGRNEFGTRLEDSPSARALRKRSDLPWTGGREVFVVPLAAGPETEVGDAMPYSVPMRHYGGYFFRTADGVLQIRMGVIHSVVDGCWAVRSVDVNLRTGTHYWALQLSGEGGLAGGLRTFAPSRRRSPEDGDETVLAEVASLEEVLSGERAPVELRVDGDVTLGALADCLQRLDAAGFDEVFVDEMFAYEVSVD